jgi:hypothetical protein
MAKMVRKQLFVTAEQSKRLKECAAATGMSESELIRAGIDLRLEQEHEKRRAWQSTVDEMVANLSGAWAERENLEEEMREIRGRWNRREMLLGKQGMLPAKKAKRAS